MTLPSSGAISLGDVNVELTNSRTQQLSLGSTAVRNLFGVSSGGIRLGTDSRGKTYVPPPFSFTVTTNQQEFDIFNAAVSRGWDQAANLTVTIGSGVYIYSDTALNAALKIRGTFPRGITIYNYGYIIGLGGDGGSGVGTQTAGWHAINVDTTSNVVLYNFQYIAGGGGGGAGGNATNWGSGGAAFKVGGGGGAGGGRGGGITSKGANLGGVRGTVGNPGGAGTEFAEDMTRDATISSMVQVGGGAGGGRMLPGTGGSPGTAADRNGKGGGAGGGGGTAWPTNGSNYPGDGGQGGSGGATGSNATTNIVGGGGGGWGAAGGSSGTRAGAAGGKAINLNGNSIIRVNNGTIYGAIS